LPSSKHPDDLGRLTPTHLAAYAERQAFPILTATTVTRLVP
jgi:hypothetical protein